MGRLDGKRAVVTAAGQGIGKAIADMFMAEGATVFASDINGDLLAGAGFTDGSAIKTYAKNVGAIDVLCNIAGFVHHGTVLDTSDAEWDFSFDLNVKSMHRTIRAFLPGMLKDRTSSEVPGASIVNMSSGASSLKGAPNRYVYGASKAAVIGLTKGVAVDFAGQGLRCNAICPGTVESPSLQGRIEALGEEFGSVEKARAAFVARQPMGRNARADEIASLALYLASDEAAFVTGGEFKIDGGWML